MAPRRISILGATGSIGQNTLDLIGRRRNEFQVVALTGHGNVDQLAADARAFGAEIAVTADSARYGDLKAALTGSGVEAAAGEAALSEAAARPADWVMSAIVGAAGLPPGLAALETGATLALANKESLVCAGPLLLDTARANSATILPVDSEHSAIFQALVGEDLSAVTQITITASGGALRDWPLERLAKATPDDAACHPNWDMGQRITIDSASLFNKAMELIETKEFFGVAPGKINAVIHPESIIHALVSFADGATMAHMGQPDMRHAIGYALNWPERRVLPVAPLDLAKMGQLTFRAPEPDRHPALAIADRVMKAGGLAGAAFNAAKERALDAFIARDIGFLDMARIVDRVVDHLLATGHTNAAITLDNVRDLDHLARVRAAELITDGVTG